MAVVARAANSLIVALGIVCDCVCILEPVSFQYGPTRAENDDILIGLEDG